MADLNEMLVAWTGEIDSFMYTYILVILLRFPVDAKPSRYFSAAATLRAAAVMDRSFTSTVMSAYFS